MNSFRRFRLYTYCSSLCNPIIIIIIIIITHIYIYICIILLYIYVCMYVCVGVCEPQTNLMIRLFALFLYTSDINQTSKTKFSVL